MERSAKLSPPWIIYFRQVEALFHEDPAVKVIFDESTYTLKIYVEGVMKAEAIEQLLPETKEFGNVVVHTIVYPSNLNSVDKLSLIQKAFNGNPALSDVVTIDFYGDKINYVLFKKEVVQFFNDDMSDAHGLCSTLYQELAKEVFGDDPSVFYCTDVDKDDEGKLGKPLGEWP